MKEGVFITSSQVYNKKSVQPPDNSKTIHNKSVDNNRRDEGTNTSKTSELSPKNQAVENGKYNKVLGTLVGSETREKSEATPEQLLDFPGANDMPSAERLLEDLVSELKDLNLKFEKDKETDRTVIKVIDNDTGEVIRQIPPQEFLEMVASLNKVAAELLKDLPRYI